MLRPIGSLGDQKAQTIFGSNLALHCVYLYDSMVRKRGFSAFMTLHEHDRVGRVGESPYRQAYDK